MPIEKVPANLSGECIFNLTDAINAIVDVNPNKASGADWFDFK